MSCCAIVLAISGGGGAAADLTDKDLRERGVTDLPLQNADLPNDEGAPDMCTLNYLHEAAVLHNLRIRFFATKVGNTKSNRKKRGIL